MFRRFYRPESAINVFTCMRLRQMKSSGTTPPATDMWTSRMLRHHPKLLVHPANINEPTSVVERKQVRETPSKRLCRSSSVVHMDSRITPTETSCCDVLAVKDRCFLFTGENGFGHPARRRKWIARCIRLLSANVNCAVAISQCSPCHLTETRWQ